MISHLPQRVAVSAGLTAPVAAVEMSRHLAGWPDWHGPALGQWQLVMAIVTTIVVFLPGWPLLAKGARSYRLRTLNMFSLIAPGVLITYAFSLAGLIAPEYFPESFRMHGAVPVYFEAAAMITTLVLLGQWLENRAERHTGDALETLALLLPDHASVLRDNGEQRVPVDEIRTGDLIQLRAGDRVPVDGPVMRGDLAVDESMITGESMPVLKHPGALLVGGTIAREGAAVMRAEKTGPHTLLARIIDMVREAQSSKAPIQRIADRVTGKLVPFVLALAALTFVLWLQLGPPPAVWYALLHAVTVLMITCPCALGLATPVSIMAGLGRGALDGILVKHAASLEQLASVQVMVLDKTGTLTTGRPTLNTCIARDAGSEDKMLAYAASLEQFSHHPVALAITEAARARGLTFSEVNDFRSEAGGGVAGRIEGMCMIAGRKSWLSGQGASGFDALDGRASAREQEGHTVTWLAIDGDIKAIFTLSDTIKPDAAGAVALIKKQGLRILMITGDNERAAGYVAQQLGIDEVHAGVKPGEKSHHVEKLRDQGLKVAMVGDGVNDAPALAAADVGVSMGTGTGMIIARGDINLMHGDVISLARAIEISRATMRNIRQNLFFAFAYNAIMIPVAAGAIYPWTGWVLTPMLASVAMSASSLTVITNALRLRRRRLT